jgi:hypothetical protein
MRKALAISAALEPVPIESASSRYARRKGKKKADRSMLRYGCPTCGDEVAVLPGWFPRKQPEMAQRTLETAMERHRAEKGCRQ